MCIHCYMTVNPLYREISYCDLSCLWCVAGRSVCLSACVVGYRSVGVSACALYLATRLYRISSLWYLFLYDFTVITICLYIKVFPTA
jgi:hypothetical protein